MKILVPIKRVADPQNANKVKVSDDGKQVTSEGLEWMINPFDEWSLEAALRLTENAAAKTRVGEVVAVTIGPKDAESTLRREALARGAERGILIEGSDDALDGSQVAELLAALVEKEAPDLVLMGKQVVDGDSNVVPQLLGEKLGWPVVNYAQSIVTADDGKTLTLQRETDVGIATLRVQGPAVITCADRILQPASVKNGVTPDDFAYPQQEGARYAGLKGLRDMKKKPVQPLAASELGIEPQASVSYLGFQLPPARTGSTQYVESAEDLVEALRTQAKVL